MMAKREVSSQIMSWVCVLTWLTKPLGFDWTQTNNHFIRKIIYLIIKDVSTATLRTIVV